MNFYNYSEEPYADILNKNQENELINRIFVSFLVILITIANVLMGCEVTILLKILFV